MNVLVLSATASAINYQKALAGRSDVRLFLCDASPYASGLYGPGVTPVLLPRARDLDRYREALDRAVKQHDIDILIPTSDHDMEGTMELRQRGWGPPVAMFRPDYEVFRTLTHKARLMDTLQARGLSKGVEVPRTYRHADEVCVFPQSSSRKRARRRQQGRLDRAPPSRAGRPAGPRPQKLPGRSGHAGNTSPGAHREHLRRPAPLWPRWGKLYTSEAASHSHLTFMTWGGGGNAGVVAHEPELLAQARAIIAALGGWAGPVNLEFKRHQDNGRFYLMEVNCRSQRRSQLLDDHERPQFSVGRRGPAPNRPYELSIPVPFPTGAELRGRIPRASRERLVLGCRLIV